MRYTKEYLIIFIILLFIIISEFITVRITKVSLEKLYNRISRLEEDIRKKEIGNSLQDFLDEWKLTEKRLSLFMEHSELDKISTKVTNLKINLETDNYLNVPYS